MKYGDVSENDFMPHWNEIQKLAYKNAYECVSGNPFPPGSAEAVEYRRFYSSTRDEILEAIESGEIGVVFK